MKATHPMSKSSTPSHRASYTVLISWLIGASLLIWVSHAVAARDLVAPKEQTTTEVDPTQSPSFDDQKKGIPQSLFTWIKMAKGYEVEWDSFGRKGWYTQDPRLKPVDPTTTFTPDTPTIYIVFEVAPLEDPGQFSVQWFKEEEGKLPDMPLGRDSLEVPGHERYGFLEMKRSGDKWPVGKYLAKIFIAPLGQQPFHAANQVGMMRFTVAEMPAKPSPAQKPLP
jgi:hypothetical protein